jgi:hypothetical protein
MPLEVMWCGVCGRANMIGDHCFMCGAPLAASQEPSTGNGPPTASGANPEIGSRAVLLAGSQQLLVTHPEVSPDNPRDERDIPTQPVPVVVTKHAGPPRPTVYLLVLAYLLLLLAVILILAAGISSWVRDGGNSSTHTAHGILEVHNPAALSGISPGGGCAAALAGSGGAYSGIRPGLRVDVTNQDSTYLGSGPLAGGKIAADGGCLFTFTVPGLPPAQKYGFTVDRYIVWYSWAEINSDHWIAAIQLGNT